MTADAPLDHKRIERVARCFDETGRLQRWPSKRADQLLLLWVVWSYIPADTRFTEPEVNSMLRDWHDYEDYVLLRRELVDLGLLQRTPTGSVYRRGEAEVPPDGAALIARFTPAT